MKDKHTLRAKKEGYEARSAYKLFAINRKFRILQKHNKVLDIGCWPGSWLQVCLKFQAKPVGVDKKKTFIQGVETFTADILEDSIFDKLQSYGKFDVILSDVAPSTSGKIEIDQYKSYELSSRAFEIARKVLKEKGNFVVKIFQGEEAVELFQELKKNFRLVKSFKPAASKKRSKEVYYVCLGYKG